MVSWLTLNSQNLLDHQQLQGDGLDVRGKSVARYTPHTESTDATIDVLPEAMAVPDLLDAAIMTCVYPRCMAR